MGGRLVHGGRDGQTEMPAAKKHRIKLWVRGADPRRKQRKLRMNITDKPMPIASLPDNGSAFNGHEVLPWDVSLTEAAAPLRRARSLRARGQATVSVEAVGRYRLSNFNTLVLSTKLR